MRITFFLLFSFGAWAIVLPPTESETLGKTLTAYEFLDERDRKFSLESFRGKPLVINPIYVSCPHTCSPILSNLRAKVSALGGLGQRYEVLTISFDPKDKAPQLLDLKNKLNLSEGWRLGYGDEKSIQALLGTIDFRLITLDDGGFAHPDMIAVFDKGGRLSGYVYGVDFTLAEFKSAIELAESDSVQSREFARGIFIISMVGIFFVIGVIVMTLFSRRRLLA